MSDNQTFTRQDCLEKIDEYLNTSVTIDTPISDIDSLEFFELVQQLEHDYGVQLSREQILRLTTVWGLVLLIEEAVSA